ncbi:MAG: 16S rRNA (guanine(966)-N(2))-methyltransferase RsmD [Proteobacteria bacterium]|nr:16S rRNA (guanine(966)-N(2))-methyltransferase RsmD [Pseudomonadota bacterium]
MSREGSIRIIGGKWRGRLLKVLDAPGLRPTPDRIRETLFNWLGTALFDARCLDLFAGTGALGFEALSRGAKHVIFVDKYPPAIQMIQKSVQVLDAQTSCDIVRASAINYLNMLKEKEEKVLDIIFLDPPFASNLLKQSFECLASSHLVNEKTLLYAEAPSLLCQQDIPSHWLLLKAKMTGEVAYHLIQGRPPA